MSKIIPLPSSARFPLDEDKITSGDHERLLSALRFLVRELNRSYADISIAVNQLIKKVEELENK